MYYVLCYPGGASPRMLKRNRLLLVACLTFRTAVFSEIQRPDGGPNSQILVYQTQGR